MSADSTSIYTGPWVNWSHGLILGSTITLSARNGAILTAFLATFITIVGAQLWKILCFIFHHSRASQKPKDGLYHQRQNVFRNSNSPGGAAWSFMLLSWCWRGRARHSVMRSLPWALFSILYLVVFAVLSVFGSSNVTKAAGQDRLLRGSQCGYWGANITGPGLGSFDAKSLRDGQNAASYARDCYSESVDALKCKKYATPHLKWDEKQADCPFKDGICYENYISQVDSGLIDSHDDLGVNTPVKERLKYRWVTTCSILREKGYIDINDAKPFVTWNYGPSLNHNSTFSYDKQSIRTGVGYTVNVVTSEAGRSSVWEPIPPLNRTDADVTLIFIAPNSIVYETPVDDPIFSAHLTNSNLTISVLKGQSTVFYTSDYYLGVIGCAEQHQVCYGDICTALSGHTEVFSSSSLSGLSMAQQGIFERLGLATIFTTTASAIGARSGTALLASETVRGTRQASLPSNQWRIEVSSWFTTSLARLQFSFREFAAFGQTSPDIYIRPPETPAALAMCHGQKILTTNGTISFSVLGLAIILVVGALLIFTSFILEPVTGWIGLKSQRNWVMDDKLQLQRMVFEGRGIRWNTEGAVPVTEGGEKFPSLTGSAESEPLMDQDEKAVGMDVREVR